MKSICIFVVLVCVSFVALAKEKTKLIEIRGDRITVPLEIRDEQTVRQFSVWNGPGTRSYDAQGNLNPPAYLDPSKTEGRFVDWPKGIVNNVPEHLDLFQVTFYLGESTSQRSYPFTYGVDHVSGQGFIHLPHSSSSVISHGNWLYASANWDKLILPMIL